MKKTTPILTAIFLCVVCSAAYAMWGVADTGMWPKSWPEELEPLRDHSRTLTGGILNQTYYEITFTEREDFESAWPQLLKVKSEGSPLILVRSPYTRMGKVDAGVIVRAALARSDKPDNPETPIEGVTSPRERWMYTTFIELIVDGDIVDLNRIPLPADTPIIDERFEKEGEKR